MGEWRKLHKEELRDSYTSPSIMNNPVEDEMGGPCSTNGGEAEHV
jgi:hypothetical protein